MAKRAFRSEMQLSFGPHCPGDLVAKGSEFSSEARSHLTVALSSGGTKYMEESELKGLRTKKELQFPFCWRVCEANRKNPKWSSSELVTLGVSGQPSRERKGENSVI